MTNPKIVPFLWIEDRAQEAADFYVSVFRNARVTSSARLPQEPGAGSAVVSFVLDGQPFTAFDGHPALPFTPAISFVVNCDTQDEIDYLWERLSAGGAPGPCGWLEDKFGISWQVIPSALPEMLRHESKAVSVLQAMLQMTKLDLCQLQDAYDRG